MGGKTAIAGGLVAGLVTGAIVMGAVVLLAPGPAASDPGRSPDQVAGIGQPAPPLAVPQLGGGEIALANLEGSPVWVSFMASWCPPCREELPIMNGLAARYADTGLVVVAIDVREDESVADAFARELQVAFPVGLDTDGSAQSDWGAFALPVHYWIDADGIVRDGASGDIGPDIMARGLESILPGVEVTR
jgi:cytochrome c biogenesis protein CcmG/thiol:disulfide interchange protein DsbE